MSEALTTTAGSDTKLGMTATASPANPPGFQLLGEVGRGGMGVVYRARDTTLDRDVAIKLLSDRYPPNSPAAQRFLNEARITGQLQHPGIPAVHQVGSQSDGRPFLAMKLIKGRTLDAILKDWPAAAADRGRLLAVFEAVCQAVGYAHAHDVIHRDLKPANVMVGAFGEVQVMDWGLAKVLGGQIPESPSANLEATLATGIRPAPDSAEMTQAGSLLGTPAFMPPEQAIGAVDQIDRQSDVFGLGAILCTILTGQPPFVGANPESTRQLAARGKLDDAFARLAGSGAEPELVALCRRCLAAEKADRPADAGELASAVAGLRAAADERARQAEVQRERAEAEKTARETAEAVLKFMHEVFVQGSAYGQASATRGVKRELTVKEAIDYAVTTIEGQFRDRPDLEAAVRSDIGETYYGLGAWTEAAQQFEKAISVLEKTLGPDNADVLNHVSNLAATLDRMGELPAAERLFQRALVGLESARGPDHPHTLRAVNGLALVYQAKKEYAAAEPLYRRALEGLERVLGPDHPETLISVNSLSFLYKAQKNYAAVEPLLKRALAGNEKALGPDHPDTLIIVTNLANLYTELKNYPVAEQFYSRALAGFENAFGTDHPHTLHCVNGMGALFAEKGDMAAAEAYYRRAMVGREACLGPDHPSTLKSVNSLAVLYLDTKRFGEAALLLQAALRGYEKRPECEQDALTARSNLGLALLGDGQGAEAEPHLLAGYDGLTKEKSLDGASSARLRRVTQGLVELYDATRQQAKAAEWRAKLAPLSPEVPIPHRPAG